MRPYLVFAYSIHDANGGWNDFIGTVEAVTEEAVRTKLSARYGNGKRGSIDIAQVVDPDTNQLVASYYVEMTVTGLIIDMARNDT